MHASALFLGDRFFTNYCLLNHSKILEIGSCDINGGLRNLAPKHLVYTGIDQQAGPGVDIVLQDPHHYPFPNDYFDFVVSTSCFEHDNFFWLTILECVRVLKPGGFIYINAPSNGVYHPCPRDNWRFYPDAGLTLQDWCQKNKLHVTLLESFIFQQTDTMWNDCVMIFTKGPFAGGPTLISYNLYGVENVRTYFNTKLYNYQEYPEDKRNISELVNLLSNKF